MILSRPKNCLVVTGMVVLLGCGQKTRPHLPAMSYEYSHVDNTVTFELPDSGGFVANGVFVTRNRIAPLLREVFADRSPEVRAVFVVDNPGRDWADVQMIDDAARAAGGRALDAKLSGRMPLQDFTELPPIERP